MSHASRRTKVFATPITVKSQIITQAHHRVLLFSYHFTTTVLLNVQLIYFVEVLHQKKLPNEIICGQESFFLLLGQDGDELPAHLKCSILSAVCILLYVMEFRFTGPSSTLFSAIHAMSFIHFFIFLQLRILLCSSIHYLFILQQVHNCHLEF